MWCDVMCVCMYTVYIYISQQIPTRCSLERCKSQNRDWVPLYRATPEHCFHCFPFALSSKIHEIANPLLFLSRAHKCQATQPEISRWHKLEALWLECSMKRRPVSFGISWSPFARVPPEVARWLKYSTAEQTWFSSSRKQSKTRPTTTWSTRSCSSALLIHQVTPSRVKSCTGSS